MASSDARRAQVKRSLKKFVDKGLAKAGFHLSRATYAHDGLATIHNDHFRQLPGFRAAYGRGVEAGHGVDPAFEWRVHVALWAAKASLRAAGDFIECGVNAGVISSAIMHRLGWGHLDRDGRAILLRYGRFNREGTAIDQALRGAENPARTRPDQDRLDLGGN